MRLGACFPTNEIGNDPLAIRDWAQATEALGYDFIEVYDHVLSHDPAGESRGDRSYDLQTAWHEPLIILGYLAAVTERTEFLTGILILPQRQTALVAKQVAEIDILSGGRMMLGIGLGWSELEYEALGQDFRSRGARSEEQIELLRELWAKPLVTFEGRFDRIADAGIHPRPKRSIPIWIGGHAPVVLDRIGRVGDGWVSGWSRPGLLAEGIERIHEAARAAGRDPASIGVETRARVARWNPEEQAAHARRCEEAGATHFALHTLEGGLSSVEQHIGALRDFRDAFGA